MKRAFWTGLSVMLLASASVTVEVAEAARVVIKTAPPAVRKEVIIVRPGPNHVWVPGYWAWQGGTYVWVAGAWQVPPRPRAVWVPGHYKKVRGGWVWVPGHWK